MIISEINLHNPEKEIDIEYPFVETLVKYVTTRDPQILKDKVLAIPQPNPEDASRLEDAVNFMEWIHFEQERIYDTPINGQKKPFITHTLAATLMVKELMGDEATTDTLIASLLHDSIEDGKLIVLGADGNLVKRDVTKTDIEERFGTRVANAVESLSHVRDEKQSDGTIKRRKLDYDEYAAKMRKYHEDIDPDIGIFYIKVGGDRSTNLLDPFRKLRRPLSDVIFNARQHDSENAPKKDARTSRKEQFEHTETYLLPRIGDNPKLQSFMQDVMDLARLSLKHNFEPDNWKQQLKRYQERHPRRK